MSDYVENILLEYLRATDVEVSEGMEWYADAHSLALELSPDDIWRGAGVIAAFSPQRAWSHNVITARNAFDTGIASGHTKVMCAQAQAILDGAPALDILKGPKVRAFAAGIATKGDTDIVTIDRHAHDIAMGRRFTDKARNINKSTFNKLSAAYVEAAEIIGVSAATLQAITWVSWRNRFS